MAIGKQIFKVMNQGHTALYRATKGRVGAMGGTVLLLTTTGARTGRERTVPLRAFPHDDGWVVVASAAGAPRHPGWYHNLVANPEVRVEYRSEAQQMTARVADAAERPGLWDQVVATDKRFAGYESKTDREIPVVILEPAAGS